MEGAEEVCKSDKQNIVDAESTSSDLKNSPRVKAFDSAIQKYVRLICEEQCFANALARSFKPVYRANKEQFMKKANAVEESLRHEVTDHLTEKSENFQIRQKLFELDILQEEYERNNLAWRPSGNPVNDVKAYIYAVKVKHLVEHKENVKVEYQCLKKELDEKVCEYQRKKDLFKDKTRHATALIKIKEYEEQIQNLTEIINCPEITENDIYGEEN